MNMQEIWKKRLRLHEKKMARYLKYVLNDHFVIVCFFIFGALSLGYSNIIKTLDTNFFWGRWIALLVFIASVSIGKLATLIEAPDAVFLLPKEQQLPDYLKGAKRYSFLLPGFVIVLLTAFIMPLLVATTSYVFLDMLYFVVTLLLLKNWDLDAQLISLKISHKNERLKWQGAKLAVITLIAVISLFLNPIVGVVLAIALQIISLPFFKKMANERIYQWELMVASEEQRMHRIYQFINLFTDIPSLKGQVKRRRYLDGLLKGISKDHNHTFDYLYARTFLRGTEYSGLYVRLTAILVLLVIFTQNFVMALLLSILFIYLTGFQLLPMYFHYENMALTRLYPIKMEQKAKALKQLFVVVLGSQAVIIFSTSLVTLSIVDSLIVLAASLGFVGVFTQIYVPVRIKKMLKVRLY
ncbi:ABC transporter permease [Carnobacterium gallinarum]|uniref:ABC transporter permease n=1 Tax=Carnobacterium gallinarum TaxID=2749 RepID=UPI0005538960|nr:ABC transporter permease [Carnobacterium gallinarum]